MNRASLSLLSQLCSSKKRTNFRNIINFQTIDFFFSEISSTPNYENPLSSSPHTHFKSSTKTSRIPKTIQFQNTPSRNHNTLAEKSSQLHEISDIEEEFELAETTEDIMNAFREMESVFEENDPKLGLACLKVALHLEKEGNRPQKALQFATQALKILDNSQGWDLQVATAAYLMGSVNCNLKMYKDGLKCLESANCVLGQLESAGVSIKDISAVLLAVNVELANTKTIMGRREEALVNHKKCLDIKEMILEPESWELCVSNRELAEAYVELKNFKGALPHCSRALEIRIAHEGDNSVDVGYDRRLLQVIYTGLEQHQEALNQNLLSRKIFKKWGLNVDLLRAEIDFANIDIALGKYREAMDTLRSVLQRTEKESKNRALVYITMAKLMCILEDFEDSKRCLEISCGILEKKEIQVPKEVAEAYIEMAILYEKMDEFETAIRLLERALFILHKLPQEKHLAGDASGKLGWLLFLTGNVKQAIRKLKDAVDMLRVSMGSNHFSLGHVYKNLGSAYLVEKKAESAAEVFRFAKEIMDVTRNPFHTDAIEACQNLSEAYAAIGSYDLAIEFQERAVKKWKIRAKQVPTAQNELREAKLVLDKLKERALELSSPKGAPCPEKCISPERLQELFFGSNY